jgi:hypothetical protein
MLEYSLPIGQGCMILKIIGDGENNWKVTCLAGQKIQAYGNLTKCIESSNAGTCVELMHMGNALWKVINETLLIIHPTNKVNLKESGICY